MGRTPCGSGKARGFPSRSGDLVPIGAYVGVDYKCMLVEFGNMLYYQWFLSYFRFIRTERNFPLRNHRVSLHSAVPFAAALGSCLKNSMR